MNSLINKIPDFAGQRKELLESIEYPCELDINQFGYSNELNRLNELCNSLNKIVKAYKTILPYENGMKGFKDLLLAWVVKMPNEKELGKLIKSRWLSVNGITVQLKGGVKMNQEKEMQFLIDSVEFPENLIKTIEMLFRLIRSCFVPNRVKYTELYNEKTNLFEVSESIKSMIRSKHIILARNYRDVILHLLRYQLCDSLNGLKAVGYGLGTPIPPMISKLLEIHSDSSNIYNGFSFDVNPNRLIEKRLPDVEIVADSIQDNNTYDESGRPKDGYKPIELQARIDGILNNIKITKPALIFPDRPTIPPNKPIKAIEIAKAPELLKEIIFSGGSIECEREIE